MYGLYKQVSFVCEYDKASVYSFKYSFDGLNIIEFDCLMDWMLAICYFRGTIKEYAESKSYNFITIDGVKVKFNDGFALVRASNTGPNITARFEATTESRLNEIKNEFETELNKWLN